MNHFATLAQLNRYLSEYGITSFADHDDDGVEDPSVLDDCWDYGTGFLVGRLAKRYTFVQLAGAVIMPELEAVVTLRHLCLRRGNAPPESLEFRYKEITQKDGLIDQILDGDLLLVDSSGNPIAGRGGYAPSHANLTVNRRYATEQVRVVAGSSNMSPTELERDVAPGSGIE